MLVFKDDKLRIFCLLAVCWIALWVIFYPGFMSPDSMDQFGMSKSLHFNDWHPPIMSWIWSVANFFFPGPSGMLAIHITLLLFSVYIWWSNYKDYSFSWLMFAIPFLPWILNFAGVLWKDVGLAFSLFALSGLALRTATPRRILLACGLVFYAISVRYNSVFAVFPILFLLSYRWLNAPTKLKALTLSCAIVLLCTILCGFFNSKVVVADRTKPFNYVIVDDLVYLSVKHNESFLPGVRISEIKECAAIEAGQTKLVGKHFLLLNMPSYKHATPLTSELKNIWLERIMQHPIDYLKFRMAAFSYLLRTPDDSPFYIWQPGIVENSLGVKQIPNGLTLIAERFVESSAEIVPFLFKPYWWLLISVLLLIATFVLCETKSIATARALLASSIAFIVGYVPITPMADFRYVYWSVIASSISFIVLIIDWPGCKPKILKSSVIAVVSLMIFFGLIIYNHGKLVVIDIDGILNGSLCGERMQINSQSSSND